MNSTDGAAAEQLDRLRGLVTVATQRLLGDTISVSDHGWRAPSRLPEWSRGHVATHIARQADGICRLASWARSGQRQEMYASPEHRSSEIEEGSGRSGLELQIDLDTSAGRLEQAWESLDDGGSWDAIVEMRGGLQVPARLLPLARLLEVAIHHVDLDIGYEISDLDSPTAEWLLDWCSFRLQNRVEFPKLDLRSDSGFSIMVGNAGEPIVISGTSPNLLGWLMNRVDASAVRGDEGQQLPAF
jgi:maleylpyruvate isomerase